MIYVLDTNTLIYFFRGMGSVPAKLLATPPREIGIPSIVVYELQVGIAKSTSHEERTEQLDSLLSLVQILPFGLPEAKCGAEIRAALEKQGRPIGAYDILIAATALANNAVLVTRNVKEFERIQQLRVQDWYP